MKKVQKEPNFIYCGNGQWETVWIPIAKERKAELLTIWKKQQNFKKNYQTRKKK